MPQIRSTETFRYNVDLKQTLKWGQRSQLHQLQHVLVRVELSDGSSAYAEATPRPTIYGETQTSVEAIIQEEFASLLIGHHIDKQEDIDLLVKELSHIQNNNTAKGALNIALHSALASSQGQSLSNYLGVTQSRILVSYIVGTGTDETVHSEVDAVFKAGVRVFKIKIGKRIEQETALIERLQQEFPDATFYVDANQCLQAEKAQHYLHKLSDMGILYCEEPLPIHQLHARHELKTSTRMPLIADDSVFTSNDLEREIAFDTFDIINIKTARTGFSESFEMVKQARAAGKTVMIGSQASTQIGATHAALFAAAVQAEHATECTFYLKTKLHNPDQLPLIEDGLLDINSLERISRNLTTSRQDSQFVY